MLRPGGRLHLVDIGGDMTADDGLTARLVRRSPHAAGNLGDAIPRPAYRGRFDCAEIATHAAPLRWTTHLLSRRTSRLVINQGLLEARETVSCDER